MRKFVSIAIAGAVAALVFAALSAARPAAAHFRLSTTLNAGQEIPKQVVKNASGARDVHRHARRHEAHVEADVVEADGRCGRGAHSSRQDGRRRQRHRPALHAVRLRRQRGSKSGTSTISASLLKTIQKHGTYVNVHTAKNPNGEIRGQLVAKSG